jgi:hypothetical protein
MQLSGKPLVQNLERHDVIQPQKGKVREIVVIEGLMVEMRVDEPQPA